LAGNNNCQSTIFSLDAVDTIRATAVNGRFRGQVNEI
jgi:hypothetical protein